MSLYIDSDWKFGRVEDPPRHDWLAKALPEPALDPELPIIDAHHHLWVHGGDTYLLDSFLEDANTGHAIAGTIFVQCDQMYRAAGAEAFRPVGEVEFVNGIAAMSASGRFGSTRVAAGIVGKADLSLGEGIRPVLEEMVTRAGRRFVGIRTQNNFHPDPVIGNTNAAVGKMLLDMRFRAGVRELARLDRAFDLWVFHTQLEEGYDLAKSLPEARFVLGHCGGPLGYGPYRGRHDDVFQAWKPAMAKLAQLPNVWVKLGGLMNRLAAFDFFAAERPIGCEELAQAWAPWILTTIELFGVERCMFESNFPVEKYGCTYRTVWNAFKILTAGVAEDEKRALFYETAKRAYRLDID